MPILSSINSITRVNSSVKDLLVYLFELSPLDVDVLLFLMKSKKAVAIEELAKKLDRDKTTIFRSVQKLVNLGICIKNTKTLKGGGYYHIYDIVDSDTFKTLADKRIEEIKESFDRLMEKFVVDLKSISGLYR
jgi:predicted transcriptional regulator